MKNNKGSWIDPRRSHIDPRAKKCEHVATRSSRFESSVKPFVWLAKVRKMDIADLLKTKLVLFDGATGTEYQKLGLKIGEPPESLTLSHPDIVGRVHRSYIDAGSQVVETNTFGGNRKRLDSAGLEKSIAAINRIGAEIALESARGKILVAGSVGPLGVLIEPYGDLEEAEALDVYGEQVSLLLGAGIEFILVETMISLREAVLALQAASQAGARSVGVTLTFDLTPDGPRTPFGESPAQCVEALEKEGALLIGSNCGRGFDVMRSVAREFKAKSKAPVLIQPNAGLPETSAEGLVYPEGPLQFAKFVRELSTLGIECIGGCCGTTPAHIASASEVLFRHQ
jgi:5-methyltetrahydrofolate--homocysteine methyltransferase